MILELLPGLQDDALFLLRMDSTAFHFLFLHIPLPSHLPLVLRV